MRQLTVAICNTKCTSKGRYICDSFAEGVKKLGDKCVYLARDIVPDTHFRTRQDQYNYILEKKLYKEPIKQADVMFCVCSPNRAKSQVKVGRELGFRNIIEDYSKKLGKRVMYIDSASLKTEQDFQLKYGEIIVKAHSVMKEYEEEIYYQLGYNGIKGNAKYYNKNCPPDRWKQLKLDLKPWRKNGKHILLIGQTFHGQSTQYIDIYQWYSRVIKTIRKYTDRLIIYRMHPRIFARGPRSRKDSNSVFKRVHNYKNISVGSNKILIDDLKDCWASVVYSSNAAVTSLINGIPCFTEGKNCIAYEVGNKDFSELENPKLIKREQWLYNLAYSQWNCREMKEGKTWKHLKPYVFTK